MTMEISQIENWPEIERLIAELISELVKINADTEKDIYGYFQGIKDINRKKNITCPFCDKEIDPIEVGIEPQRTMTSWEDETRSEDNSMTFPEMREHLNHQVTRQIVNVLIQSQLKPTDVESRLSQMDQLVKTMSYISELLADLIPAIDRAQTQEDIIHTMTETITDIRKAIKKSI